MSVTFNPAADCPSVIDNVESVYLHRAAGGDPVPLDGALRRGQAARQYAGSGGGAASSEVRWHLPLSVLEDAPSIGDRIVDAASVPWTIVEVHREGSGRWLCIGRSLALVHGLSETIDIERAVWTKDAAGAAVATWHPWQTAVPARIQPVAAKTSDDEGRWHILATHRVLLANPLSIDENCRIVGPGGTVYRVLMLHVAEQLEALHIIDVLEEPHA